MQKKRMSSAICPFFLDAKDQVQHHFSKKAFLFFLWVMEREKREMGGALSEEKKRKRGEKGEKGWCLYGEEGVILVAPKEMT